MSRIPTKYLAKMGDYVVDIDGAPMKVKVVDDVRLMEQLLPTYFGNEDVFGIDNKLITLPKHSPTHHSNRFMFVICGGSGCLLIHCMLRFQNFYIQMPETLQNFLANSQHCFVKPFSLGICYGVASGELVARVLKKPSLLTEKNLEAIACEVQVPYKDPYPSSTRASDGSIRAESSEYARVLTTDEVRKLVYDAVTCYKLGTKLLKGPK